MSADLTTRYLGLELSSPVVASASPLTGDVETVRALVDAGAAAVVMPSLFEEEILQEELELTRAMEAGAEHFSEAATYFPSVPELVNAADRYVACLAELKGAVEVPIVASLNADTRGGWVRHAGRLASAGPMPSSSTSTRWPPTPNAPGSRSRPSCSEWWPTYAALWRCRWR
jgi:dihydroorotate dehydrogenase (fumarate)